MSECVDTMQWSKEIMWQLRLQEQIIHESHGEESQLYFTQFKALLMHMLQKQQALYVGYAMTAPDTQAHAARPDHAAPQKPSDPRRLKYPSNAIGAAHFRLATGEEGAAFSPHGYKCKNCGSTDIATVSKQLRSADEGETIFCECRSCAKRGNKTRWRIN